ncbi:MAG TPA: hypothetical protein VMG08_06255 [Allosphingosinicella sp.]|nr:hypothetical protein [Allosphingosinicella sp.]
MRNTPYLAAAASAALLALAGCNSDPVEINTVEADSNAPTTTLNASELPPSITASKTYRCSYPSNALFYVEFYSDNRAALRQGDRNATPKMLTGTSPTGPFEGEGATLSGNGNNVTINGQSCRA